MAPIKPNGDGDVSWVPKHIAVAPFGVFFFTAFLWSQGNQHDLPAFASYTGLGAVIHGMAASATEATNSMFYIMEKRKKLREKTEQKGATRRIAMLEAVATPEELEVLRRLLERADAEKSNA